MPVKLWPNLLTRLLRASDSSVREADCLNLAQYFSAGNADRNDTQAREAGDRAPSAMPKSVARFAGFVLVFWPSFPAMNRWVTIDRPLADSFRSF